MLPLIRHRSVSPRFHPDDYDFAEPQTRLSSQGKHCQASEISDDYSSVQPKILTLKAYTPAEMRVFESNKSRSQMRIDSRLIRGDTSGCALPDFVPRAPIHDVRQKKIYKNLTRSACYSVETEVIQPVLSPLARGESIF